MSAPAVMRRLVMIVFGLALAMLVSHDVIPSHPVASTALVLAGHVEEHRDPEAFDRRDHRNGGTALSRTEVCERAFEGCAVTLEAFPPAPHLPLIASAPLRPRPGDVPHPPPRMSA